MSREVDHVYGQAALSLRTVERWLARFAAGDETLEDLPRSGRPRSDSNIALITQLLTDDPYLSQKMIA
jgi:transposase